MIKRYKDKKRVGRLWGAPERSNGGELPLKLYYAGNDLEVLVGTVASAYPHLPVFIWESSDRSDWPGAEDFQYFAAPYRIGSVFSFYRESPAVEGTLLLLPGAEEVVSPCVECKYTMSMLSGECSLFDFSCERKKGTRWGKF